MTRPPYELADVVRRLGPAYEVAYGNTLTPAQRQSLRAIATCRTAALGGHVEACDGCGHRRNAYNSCRNRHCPKCQASARAEWLDRQAEDLLPVEYFHVVFTLPNAIGPLALQNPRRVYAALFRAAAESLTELAADTKHLGAAIGFLAVLHTWGQTLTLHPHVHCVVPGGGLTPDGRWKACRPGYFLPVKPLSRLFRGKFLALLADLYAKELLTTAGQLAAWNDPTAFARWLAELRRTDWVVYAKPPFGGPEQVLKYLARYTHRVAISNHRLVAVDDKSVSFRWKDYADDHAPKTMTLGGVEFLRRFLQHVLPAGFVRIRHFGFLANRARAERLTRCRAALNIESLQPPNSVERPVATREPGDNTREEPRGCPACGVGRMTIVELIPRSLLRPLLIGSGTDSS